MSRRLHGHLTRRIHMQICAQATQIWFDTLRIGAQPRRHFWRRAPRRDRRQPHVRVGMIGGTPNFLKTSRCLSTINSLRPLSSEKVLRLLCNEVMS